VEQQHWGTFLTAMAWRSDSSQIFNVIPDSLLSFSFLVVPCAVQDNTASYTDLVWHYQQWRFLEWLVLLWA